MIISMILAVSDNGVIGRNNQLPWKKVPADLRYFKKVTSGHSVIMGRKTYQSLGRALPNRRNIVITRNRDWKAPDVEIFYDLGEAVKACVGEQEVFVIGGSMVYAKALELDIVDRIHLTRIHTEVKGDTFFTMPEDKKWLIQSKEKHLSDEKNPYDYTFILYHRQDQGHR